eukprot:TRINITY_DN3276_c0_g1_i2.p2 TRINITY_DN3276_c0_g1~~TRINITY_DN3276_c0_g1_i2.p2  ORF type:complete len:176 (-),score=67.50 TRINITY_DN3276_c0_g1_i2:39-566(-)
MGKQKYTKEVEDPTKVAMASGSNLRVHFKNTREAATAIKGLSLVKARRFLEDVLEHKRVVPFRRFTGGIGRPAMMKGTGWSQGRWPAKSCNFLLDLITNLEATAEVKELDPEHLVLKHVQVQRAPKYRRRTYRAHGRINAYMCSPCHIQLIATEDEAPVPKPAAAGKSSRAAIEK